MQALQAAAASSRPKTAHKCPARPRSRGMAAWVPSRHLKPKRSEQQVADVLVFLDARSHASSFSRGLPGALDEARRELKRQQKDAVSDAHQSHSRS